MESLIVVKSTVDGRPVPNGARPLAWGVGVLLLGTHLRDPPPMRPKHTVPQTCAGSAICTSPPAPCQRLGQGLRRPGYRLQQLRPIADGRSHPLSVPNTHAHNHLKRPPGSPIPLACPWF